MKKIFILTGEPSGDKLAAQVVKNLNKDNIDLQFLCLGGEHLKRLGINSIKELNDVTYLGFTKVFLNIFKIKKNIKETANQIIKFNPDILFSVDSPDFTLRVAEIVKKMAPKIKTIHFVAPQVWVWREGRVKKIKKFIDHILLLFKFEKQYFEKENVSCKFVGHPLLEKSNEAKIDIGQIIGKNKAIISIFPGSRISEMEVLMPILINFIKLMNFKYQDFLYVFHTTQDLRNNLENILKKSNIDNYDIVSDEKIKGYIIERSIFAITKSGTISLEVSYKKIPSIVIYKINLINFLLVKFLVKVKYVNIINIAADKMIIPELLQSNCNPDSIFQMVSSFMENTKKMSDQTEETQKVLKEFTTKTSPSENVANFLKAHI
ncbi:MAG: lipid-A-disaccharide synthase [Candidatus Pelagibacter sp.]|nr:lipid-A-disaccharide synthase [Candidatus Pelagibacter sp.]OUW23478.1 MAG: lipid-A-disaccharide synthase [Rickettsiales bacterium TMED174]